MPLLITLLWPLSAQKGILSGVLFYSPDVVFDLERLLKPASRRPQVVPPSHRATGSPVGRAAAAAQKARNLALMQVVEQEAAAQHLDT